MLVSLRSMPRPVVSAGISRSTFHSMINDAHSYFNILSTYSQRTQMKKYD
jgi:hypothetical protein